MTDASGVATAEVSSYTVGQSWVYVNCEGVALGPTPNPIEWILPIGSKAVPNHGWALTPPREEPAWPGSWVHTLGIGNDDTTDAFVLKNLVIAVRPGPIDLNSLEYFTGWDTTLVGSGGMYIPPDTTIEWEIIGPEGSPPDSQHVYGHYEIWNVAGPETIPPVETWFDHYGFFEDCGGVWDRVADSSGFMLAQNRPNPFGGTTEIRYALPVASKVNLAVYDALGRRVKTVVDRYQSPGLKSVHWDGRNDRGREVSSGVYYYRLQAGKYVYARKLVLMR